MDELKEARECLEGAGGNPMPHELEVVETSVPPVQTIVQHKVETPVRAKREQVLHTLYDAKLEVIEDVKLQAQSMDLDKWSKIVARLDTEKNVKVDTTITAMGIFAMFPVVTEED